MKTITLRKYFLLAALAPLALAAQQAAETPSGPVLELQPFSVQVEKDGGYGVSSASSATRTNERLVDIPQTVNVVTSELWRATGATSYDEALKYVGNVFVRNRSAATMQFMSRGFVIDASNGFAADGVRLFGYRRDLFAYDRVEVVKGPPSSVQGRGSASGLVNFSYKKPVFGREFTSLRGTIGGYEDDTLGGFARVEYDDNRQLGDNVAVRLLGVLQQSDGFLDYQEDANKVYGVFPSLRWKIGAKSELSANVELLHTESPYREVGQGFSFHPAELRRLVPGLDSPTDPLTSLNLPRTFNAEGPPAGLTEETGTIFLTFVTNPTEAISLRQVLNYFDYYRSGEWWDAGGNFPLVGTDGSLTNPLLWGRDKTSWSGLTLQGDAIGKYGLKGVNFTTMLGYAYNDSENDTANFTGTPVPARFNFRNPTFNRTITNVSLAGSSSNVDSTTWGLYIQQGIDFWNERLALVGGWRRDYGDNTTVAPTTGAKVTNKSDVDSWRYGMTFKVLPNVTLYGIKSLQNDPTTTSNRYSNLLAGDPRANEQLTYTPSTELEEVGLKGEFLNGRVTGTAAYFRTSRTGTLSVFTRVEENPPGSGQTRIITENLVTNGDKSSGWEFTAFGSVTRRLNVTASYARNETSQPVPGNPGATQEIVFTPEWAATLFASYNFRNDQGRGWEIRAGGRAMGPFTSNATGVGTTSRVFIPTSQYTYDAGVSYSFNKSWEADLQVNNLNDAVFLLVRADPPRAVRFSIRTQF